MKNLIQNQTIIPFTPFSIILILLLCFIILSSSCSKDDPKPDLVPITMTGENTMGFYVDGVPHNKKGVIKSGESSVSWGKYNDGKIKIFGGGTPNGSLRINFYYSSFNKLYELSRLTQLTGFGEFIDDAPLGGNEYYTNENVTGTMEILRLDDHIISGTFDIQLQDPITGKIIHLTDGRFDIKQ